jgi:hypothetical protein
MWIGLNLSVLKNNERTGDFFTTLELNGNPAVEDTVMKWKGNL